MKKVFTCFFIFLAAAYSACAPAGHTVKSTAPRERGISIVFVSSTMGALDPEGCGCRFFGGLARRAQFIHDAKQSRPAVLALDCGNFLPKATEAATAAAAAKAKYTLDAINLAGADVLNISASDLALGIDYLKEQEESLLFSLVSSNIKFSGTGNTVFKPYVIKAAGDMHIGILGLTDNSSAPAPPSVYIDDPASCAREAARELSAAGCSLILLLSQLSEESSRAVARDVPDIDFILGSAAQQNTGGRDSPGAAVMLFSGERGTHVGLLELSVGDAAAPFVNIAEKNAAMATDSAQAAPADNATAAHSPPAGREAFFAGKNVYAYRPVPLDASVKENPDAGRLVERYREIEVRARLAGSSKPYVEQVAGIDVSCLSEEARRTAVRIMNDAACTNGETIAASSGDQPFCKKLARMIIDGLQKEEPEEKIRYRLLSERQRFESP